MHTVEQLISQAARGDALPLMTLINQLLLQGISTDKLINFAVRHYALSVETARDAIADLIIH